MGRYRHEVEPGLERDDDLSTFAVERADQRGDELLPLVRGDLLGLPRDRIGGRHLDHRRRLRRVLGPVRDVLRHLRRPPSQAHRDGRRLGRRARRLRRRRRPSISWSTTTRCSRSERRSSGCSSPSSSPARWSATCGRSPCRPPSPCSCPSDRRGQANGMVGTVLGSPSSVTSVLSGLVVGQLGMGWALIISLVAITGALLHLLTIRVPDEALNRLEGEERTPAVDFAGAMVSHPARARPVRTDRLRRVQQPARRRVHVAARRLRAVAGLGRGLGHPVRGASASGSSPAACSSPSRGLGIAIRCA